MTPPPLPATTAFVTLLGRISIVLAVLGLLWALVLGAVVNFAALLLVGPFFDSLQDLFPPGMADPASGWQIDAQLRMTRNLVMASGMIGALAIAGVHGWLVWKLCTAQVRAEFRRHGV